MLDCQTLSVDAPDVSTNTPNEFNLTRREFEVLKLMAAGYSNRIIATRLDISFHTAKFHVQNAMYKLGVASRTEAAVYAVRNGLA